MRSSVTLGIVSGGRDARAGGTAREDPDRLAFELHSILLGADTTFVLNDDPAILDLARQVVRQRLGLDTGRNAGGS